MLHQSPKSPSHPLTYQYASVRVLMRIATLPLHLGQPNLCTSKHQRRGQHWPDMSASRQKIYDCFLELSKIVHKIWFEKLSAMTGPASAWPAEARLDAYTTAPRRYLNVLNESQFIKMCHRGVILHDDFGMTALAMNLYCTDMSSGICHLPSIIFHYAPSIPKIPLTPPHIPVRISTRIDAYCNPASPSWSAKSLHLQAPKEGPALA